VTYYAKYKERPCPGCGDVAKRPPQKLCKACEYRLEMGKEREAEIQVLSAGGEKARVAIGTKFHYGSGAHVSFMPIKDYDVVYALVRLAGLESACGSGGSEARRIHYDRVRGGYGSRSTAYVWASPEQADDIELVLDYIKAIVIKAYSDGQRNGCSLIHRLATIGTKELNQITTGVK
jgi:hypothetical protein